MRHGWLAATLVGSAMLVSCGGGPAPADGDRTVAVQPSVTTPTAAPEVPEPASEPLADAPTETMEPVDARAADHVTQALASSNAVTADTLPRVLDAMPAELAGRPGERSPSSITYPMPAGPVTLEVMEAADIYGPQAPPADRLPAGALARLVRDQAVDVRARCASTAAACVVGHLADGTALALWTVPRSDLVVAGLGPTLTDVAALTTAWSKASM